MVQTRSYVKGLFGNSFLILSQNLLNSFSKCWRSCFLSLVCYVSIRASNFTCTLKTPSHSIQKSWTQAMLFQGLPPHIARCVTECIIVCSGPRPVLCGITRNLLLLTQFFTTPTRLHYSVWAHDHQLKLWAGEGRWCEQTWVWAPVVVINRTVVGGEDRQRRTSVVLWMPGGAWLVMFTWCSQMIHERLPILEVGTRLHGLPCSSYQRSSVLCKCRLSESMTDCRFLSSQQ